MVENAALSEVNEKLSASSLRMAVVPIAQCDLLEKNARFMPAEQYRRLVENIKRDGALTSVPFAIRHPATPGSAVASGDRYRILSGNHRVQAAKDAGLTEIMVLYTDQELTRQQQVAIQLSHNAIAGQDDLAILRELYDEINDVVLKEYSGLDDVTLGRMEPPNLDPLSEKGLEYRIVSIAFLPDEAERAEALFAKVLEQALGDRTWVNRRADYDRMLDLLTVAKTQAGVKNTATAFGLLLDLAENHLDEIPRPVKSPAKKAAS
ncbi:MAG: ParB N-terminal domain-containing protein [Acidobacteria bacterium]|nr:ParB N-terminal domain-containing protein [Planctomycetota bacterium]MBE3133657.1 ParB N-terminal domain-containing protein [Acidobacteriota bacterium]